MLVISRKEGEKIRIGRDITISILDIKNGRVSIGISAPAAVPIERMADEKNHKEKAVLVESVKDKTKSS